jgi:hypothetical protein
VRVKEKENDAGEAKCTMTNNVPFLAFEEGSATQVE